MATRKRALKATGNGLLEKQKKTLFGRGLLRLLFVNIRLNEYAWEMVKQGAPATQYTDDTVVLAKNDRAAQWLLKRIQWRLIYFNML
ncbi:MAG: hypothetical protein NC548_48100 [Lachnospiraceae bacterium]|nr:hypothetical protein [Lachnospiraceae bacterium]